MADTPDVDIPDPVEGDIEGEQDSPQAESSPVEEKPEAADKEPVAEKQEETETEAEPEGEADETEPQEKTLNPKSENRFQRLANDNRALKQEIERLTGEVYQPKTAEDFEAEGLNAVDARIRAFESRQEIKEFNEQVSDAQNYIGSDSMQVLNDFAWANPDSEEFDEDLHGTAAQLLEANLIRHPEIPEIGPDGQPTGLGMVIGATVPPYQLYQSLDQARGISATKGQMKGQQAMETQLANADSAPSSSPTKTKSDPLAAIWEDEL